MMVPRAGTELLSVSSSSLGGCFDAVRSRRSCVSQAGSEHALYRRSQQGPQERLEMPATLHRAGSIARLFDILLLRVRSRARGNLILLPCTLCTTLVNLRK